MVVEEEAKEEEAEEAKEMMMARICGRGDRRATELIFGSTYSVMSAVEWKRCG